jgi:hypothetical protein
MLLTSWACEYVTELLYSSAEGIVIFSVSSVFVDSLLALLNKSMYFCLVEVAVYLLYSPDLTLFGPLEKMPVTIALCQ